MSWDISYLELHQTRSWSWSDLLIEWIWSKYPDPHVLDSEWIFTSIANDGNATIHSRRKRKFKWTLYNLRPEYLHEFLSRLRIRVRIWKSSDPDPDWKWHKNPSKIWIDKSRNKLGIFIYIDRYIGRYCLMINLSGSESRLLLLVYYRKRFSKKCYMHIIATEL